MFWNIFKKKYKYTFSYFYNNISIVDPYGDYHRGVESLSINGFLASLYLIDNLVEKYRDNTKSKLEPWEMQIIDKLNKWKALE